MPSTRHFTINLSYPVSSFAPSYTANGMTLLCVVTGTSSSAVLSGITGGGTTPYALVATSSSGENEYTLYLDTASSTTVYASVGVIRPYSMYYYSSTALTLTSAGMPSLNIVYPVTSNSSVRTYITAGRLDEAEGSVNRPYDFKNIWAEFANRPYGGRDVIDADTVNTTTGHAFNTTRSGNALVAAKHIYFNPDSTRWNSINPTSSYATAPLLVRGHYYMVTRTSRTLNINNSTGSAITVSLSWSLSPVTFHHHANVPMGSSTAESTENGGEIGKTYLTSSTASFTANITSLYTGSPVKVTSYFGNSYFTGTISSAGAILRLTSSVTDCTIPIVYVRFDPA